MVNKRQPFAMLALLMGFLVVASTVESQAPPIALLRAASTSSGPSAAEPDKGRPLVIVLDTSGSMAEEDGAGTIKLAGAQVALTQVIRQQRPGAQIGLWTYPSAGDCGPGGFAFPVRGLDQRKMINGIRSLTAGGETPTGDALRSAVDELKEDGYTGATILLISDGLSNCDPDPCQVAEDITAEGFDLTVQAAGFLISDDGMAELECIAAATGGNTYQANDADQLDDVVDDATRAILTMEVTGIPSSTPAGSATRVTVSVRNDSATDIQDARISFNFANSTEGQQAIVPAVLPPLIRVGNLKSGTGTEHTWVVSYGSRGKTGTAGYRITGWGTNAQPQTVQGIVEVTDLNQELADGGGLIKDLEGKRIAILGDSYSSGEGAGEYMPGTDQNTHEGLNQCHKSPLTYMYPLFAESDVELLACSGAKTHGDKNGVREEQVPDLRERQDDGGAVDAAFLTVGGNDIEFKLIVINCLFGHPTVSAPWAPLVPTWDTRCSDDWAFTLYIDHLIQNLPPELTETYRQISKELNRASLVEDRGGVAPLYVLAYPQAFPERQWVSFCGGFDNAEVEYANRVVDDLNAKIKRAVNTVRHEGYRVQMVTTTQETFLPDNTSCPRPQAEEYMNSVTAGPAAKAYYNDIKNGTNTHKEFMHPNAKGYRAETNTILSWSLTADEGWPKSLDEWRVENNHGWLSGLLPDTPTIGRALALPLPSAGTAVLDATSGSWVSEPADVRGGQKIDVEVRNAAPGSAVLVSLASRTRLIGTVEIGEDGSGRGTVVIPRRLASGTHQLQALGFDRDSNPMTAAQEMDVARAIPFWLVPLAAMILLSLLASALLYRRERRKRASVDGAATVPDAHS